MSKFKYNGSVIVLGTNTLFGKWLAQTIQQIEHWKLALQRVCFPFSPFTQ
ncbi:hypothetical protein LOC67_09395 [Stieleria sp. JC731]|nr:hypothetical protein [Stieleria sp. JC731]MCC9600778.1 hypothetical protein [Stieleria sp. JC731]